MSLVKLQDTKLIHKNLLNSYMLTTKYQKEGLRKQFHLLSQESWASLVAQMVKNLLQCRRPGFDPWIGKILWRKKWQPIPVFSPGESQGQRILAGYRSIGSQRVRHIWSNLGHMHAGFHKSKVLISSSTASCEEARLYSQTAGSCLNSDLVCDSSLTLSKFSDYISLPNNKTRLAIMVPI